MPEVSKDDNLNKEIGSKGKGKGEKGKKGEGKVWAKYKWWIIGGGIFVVILVWWIWHSNQGGANQQGQQAANQAAQDQAAQQMAGTGIDPATGYLYGSPADLAALGGSGSQSPLPGPAGNVGPAGPAGAPGKKQSLRDIAIEILKGRGIKNPTPGEISKVLNTLEHIGTKTRPHPVGHKKSDNDRRQPTRSKRVG